MGYELMLRRRLMMAGQAIWVEITGNLPLTLNKSLAKKFKSLIRYGKVTQPPVDYLATVTQAGAVEQRNLPHGYTEREYIDNNGEAWLDLGMPIGSSDVVTFDMAWNDALNTPFFGAYNAGGNYGSNSFVGTYYSNASQACFYANSFTVIGMFSKPVNTRSTLKWNGVNAIPTLNGEAIGAIAPPYNDFTPSINAYLFTRNQGGTAGSVDDITLYGFKVERNGAVIMNLIPATRDSDNAVGMYDKVSGSFIGNAGTGSFTAGPVATPSPNRPMDLWTNNGVLKARHQSGLPLGYALLSYARSSGTQYIDLGYKGNGNTKVEVKFRYHTATTTAASGRVFGSRITSQSDGLAIGTASGTVASTATNKAFWNYDSQPYYVADDGFGLNVWKTIVFSAKEHTIDGVSVGDDYDIVEFETPQNLKLFAFDNNGTVGCGYLDIEYCKLWDNGVLVRDVVPAKNASDVVSMFDLVSGQFLPNAGTGDFVAGAAVSDPIELYADGTPSTITDADGNTATLETLLACGSYADTEEVIAGAKTGKCGVKVFRGDDTWTVISSTFATPLSDASPSAHAYVVPICEQFSGVVAGIAVADMPEKSIKVASSSGLGTSAVFIKDSTFADGTALNAHFAAHPCILIYVLTTATTESVPGQVLVNAPLTVSAEVTMPAPTTTEAAVSTPDPKHPLPLWCNNGELVARHQSGLPLGYTELASITANNGGSTSIKPYIDTGINPSANLKVRLKCDIQKDDSSAFGASVDNNYKAQLYRYQGIKLRAWGSAAIVDIPYSGGISDIVVDFKNKVFTFNGTATSFDYTISNPINYSIFLNANNSAGSVAGGVGNNTYYLCEMWENDVLVRQLIPATRDSDNEVGMYDLASDTFFTNAGTGGFTAGAAVSDPIELYADGTPEVLTITGKNLFNSTPYKTGYYIDANGVEREASNYTNEFHIRQGKVMPSTQYTVSFKSINGGYTQRFHAYTADGTWISQVATLDSSGADPYKSATFITPANCYYIRQGGRDQSEYQLELGSTATDYEPYTAQTASVPMLLAVGNYLDEAELIGGLLTHKVGVKVLDGTENWETYGSIYLCGIGGKQEKKTPVVCSHFIYSSSTSTTTADMTIITFTSVNVGIRYDACPDVTAFKAFLAAQYAAGTPVILLYPLATETTEQTTPQNLRTYKGTTVVDTVCAVEPVAAKVIYKAKK